MYQLGILSLSCSQYSQTICWHHRWMIPSSRRKYYHGKTQYIPGEQVLVRSWLWKIYSFYVAAYIFYRLFYRLKAINTSYNFPGYVIFIVFQSESWKQSDIDSRSLYRNLITNQINANHIGHPLVTLGRNRSTAPHDLAQPSSCPFVLSTNMKCI